MKIFDVLTGKLQEALANSLLTEIVFLRKDLSGLQSSQTETNRTLSMIWDKLNEGSTPPPEPPPSPYEGWETRPPKDWPTNIGNMKVGYVVVKEEKPLHKLIERLPGGRLYTEFSENPLLGGTTRAMRTIPKAGKILMVWAEGNQYSVPENHSKSVRPFLGNGGLDVYWIMEETGIVDGKVIKDHPDRPLFIPVANIAGEYFTMLEKGLL